MQMDFYTFATILITCYVVTNIYKQLLLSNMHLKLCSHFFLAILFEFIRLPLFSHDLLSLQMLLTVH